MKRMETGVTTRRMAEQGAAAATPEASSMLLANMKEMMEEMRKDMVSSFETIITEVVTLAPLESKITSFATTITQLEDVANDHDERLTSLQASVGQLRVEVDVLTKKCDDLEGRSRRNNIRILGIPEGSEGPRPTEFVAGMLQNLLSLDEKPMLDRAHRSLRPRAKDATAPPRPFIVCVNQFQIRNDILRKARELSSLHYNGRRVFIFPDFTAAVAKKRAAFATVKKALHSCPGVKFGLIFPAILRVTLSNGQLRTFEDPELAMDFVRDNLKTGVVPGAV